MSERLHGIPLPRHNQAMSHLRLTRTTSPLAGAFALGSAMVCLALWSGRIPPAKPRVVLAPPRPVHRARHIRRVAYQPPLLVQASEVLTGAGTAAPQEAVRVLLTKAVQSGRLRVSCDADLIIVNPDTHGIIARVPAGQTYAVSLSSDGRALAGPGGSDLPSTTIRITSLNASRPMTIGTRQYLGALEARVGDAGLEVINEVRREDYIAGVVAGESVKSFPLGALKAQAVAARTFALSQMGHRPSGVDVVDTVADQVYAGVRADWPELRQAVEETAGIIATYNNEPIVAYFSADCGGETRTNTAAGLGRGQLPYLRAVVDAPAGGPDYCSVSPKHTWSQTLTEGEILPRLNTKAGAKMASITDIRFPVVHNDGRVGEVEIEGTPIAKPNVPSPTVESATPAPAPSTQEPAPDTQHPAPGTRNPELETPSPAPSTQDPTPSTVKLTLPGFDFRRYVGTNVLRSQIMTVASAGDGAWTFSGRGYGHGVGLCQWGACGMARAGIAFDAILKHYYTGIELRHQTPRTGTLEGVAKDLAGLAAPGATVRLAGTDLLAVADEKGRFRFDGLPVGTYDIVTTPVKGEAAASFAWRVERQRQDAVNNNIPVRFWAGKPHT